jgi:Zn-dependent peptidase ImmA (M78 family)
MSVAYINGSILAWARQRAGISSDTLVDKIHKNYLEWEEGVSLPTFKQAQKIAKKLSIPFGFLYLKEPPVIEQATTDLRTIKDFDHHEYSIDLQAILEDAIRKQDWYIDYLKDDDTEVLPFVGKYSLDSPVKEIANDISHVLNFSLSDRQGRTPEEFLRQLAGKAEDCGIIVLRNGKVGYNTRRTLDANEFRGFALPDPLAPLVFINTADYVPAQVFTLMHEIAHIWLNKGGVSSVGIINHSHNRTEKKCNDIAAEVLVPEENFIELWTQDDDSLDEKTTQLSKFFKTSKIVIARRATDLEFITKKDLASFYGLLAARWNNKKANSTKPGGPSFYTTFPVINSKIVTDAVCRSIYSGKLLMNNGARLLGTTPKTLDNIAKSRGLN